MSWKTAIRKMPVVGKISYRIWPARTQLNFESSSQYWEDRYKLGGNSGSGSYNRLAVFKAEILNDFVKKHNIKTVIEFGCGDGAQLDLADYPSYVGVDVSDTILGVIRKKFANISNFKFIHISEFGKEPSADLAMSLDVIYHLVEDATYNTYMRDMFDMADKFVIIYASNKDDGWDSPHVRHRCFTNWVEENAKNFKLIDEIPNRYPYDPNNPEETSFADFFVFQKM